MITREKRIIIVLSALILALIAGNVLLFYFTQRKVKQTEEALLVLKKTTAGEIKVRSLGESIEQTKLDRLALESYFVRKQDSIKFIERIEDIGRQSKLSLSISSVMVSDTAEEFRAEISTRGSFSDTFYLLTLLESLPYKIHFERVQIEKKEASSSDFLVSGVPSSEWNGEFAIVLESFIK